MADKLIARLEAAEVGSRELDGLIAREFGWHRVEPRFARNKHGGWIAPEDFIGLYSDGSPKLDGLHGTTIHRDPPRLTASLDAALALAERVLPEETFWEMNHSAIIHGKRQFYVEVFPPDQAKESSFWGHSSSAALSMCIAILKAKAQGEGNG